MMRKRFLMFLGLILVLIVIAACATQASQQTASLEEGYYAPVAPPSAAVNQLQGGLLDQTVADGELSRQAQEPQQPNDSAVQRVVLENATLVIVVDDVDAKMQSINDLSAAFGGWIVTANTTRANINGKNQVQSASITIRVPAARLDEAMTQIKTGVGTVQSENVTGQDVTQDYVDLSSQLTNLQAAEKQLQSIMDRAVKTQDVLDVYNQLVNVRGQIETIQGRIRYYDESSSFASVQVTVLPTPIVQPVEIGGWRPLETARNAFQALVNLLQGAADVVITVAIIGLPLLIVVGVPAWFFWRRRRSTRRTLTAAT
ncbi:MAG: DUF4349 domain-containing protein [Chloroflexi bacterium]|nr:DUF4349 domain-containing protein [Chloroflexota bacterium]